MRPMDDENLNLFKKIRRVDHFPEMVVAEVDPFPLTPPVSRGRGKKNIKKSPADDEI